MKKNNEQISLVVSENAFFKGTLNTPGSIKISGNYCGKIFSSQNVYIDSTAKIDGDIEAENIVVSGVIKGNISAKKRIHLTSTSNLQGDIITGNFRIDKGGIFLGTCKNRTPQ